MFIFEAPKSKEFLYDLKLLDAFILAREGELLLMEIFIIL